MEINQQLQGWNEQHSIEEKTPGQIAMSVDFNPDQRQDIKELKQIFADAYDKVSQWQARHAAKNATTDLTDTATTEAKQSMHRWCAIAKTHLEEGQMAAVKAVTRLRF